MGATGLLLRGQLPLLAVGTHHISVVQMAGEIGLHRVDIDAAQLVPLCQFLIGQTFRFCFFCRL